jgi:hypothetical protein
MGLDHVRSEIEHRRVQVGRQRREILQLQRAGLSTAAAELLLGRMHETCRVGAVETLPTDVIRNCRMIPAIPSPAIPG